MMYDSTSKVVLINDKSHGGCLGMFHAFISASGAEVAVITISWSPPRGSQLISRSAVLHIDENCIVHWKNKVTGEHYKRRYSIKQISGSEVMLSRWSIPLILMSQCTVTFLTLFLKNFFKHYNF